MFRTKDFVFSLTTIFFGLLIISCGGGGGGSDAPNTQTLFRIYYNGNGNTSGTVPEDVITYQIGATVFVKDITSTFQKTGYKFTGWNTKPDGTGTNYSVCESFLMPNHDVTLYARWTSGTAYSVMYDGNGNTSGTAPVDYSYYLSNQKVVVKNYGSLYKQGYTFKEWNTQADGNGTKYLINESFTMPSHDITLYAQWTAKPTYAVIYDGNGHDGGQPPVDPNRYEENTMATVLGNTGNLQKFNYYFNQWNTKSNGTGTNYNFNSQIKIYTKDIILYANWKLKPYTITYNGNGNTGGTVPVDPKRYLAYEQFIAATNSGNLTKDGYVFVGWNTYPDGTGIKYTPNIPYQISNNNLTLYAWWLLPQDVINVIYDGNGNTGGEVPVDPNQYGEDQQFYVQPNSGNLTKDGYKFMGWNTKPNGCGSKIKPGSISYTPLNPTSNDYILYAWWEGPGCPDSSFVSYFELNYTEYVTCTKAQPDGKIIVGGNFTKYNNISRKNILRINADGTLDTTFNPGLGANDIVNSIALQQDGKIILVGKFTQYDGYTVPGIVRLNSDGSIDTSFDTSSWLNGSTLEHCVIQNDGKLLIAGPMNTSIQNHPNPSMVRINSDGTLDTDFQILDSGIGDNDIKEIILLDDGKILIIGTFQNFYNNQYDGIVRLLSDGSVDTTFNNAQNDYAYAGDIQVDGKIILALRNKLIRLNSDGTLDTSFNIEGTFGNGSQPPLIRSVVVQNDGKIIVGGYFTEYNSNPTCNNIVRFNSDGTLDTNFLPQGASLSVTSIELLDSNYAIVAGGFFGISYLLNPYIAKIIL